MNNKKPPIVQSREWFFGGEIMLSTSVDDLWLPICNRLRTGNIAILPVVVLLLLCSLATYASVPTVVGSTQNGIASLWAGRTVTKIVSDADGNIFVASTDPGTCCGTIVKLPANGGASQTIASNIGSLWGLALGPDGSIYFTDRWGNHVQQIPYLGNGVYGSASNLFSNIPNLNNWWFGGSDIAVDSTGAIYLSYEWGGGIDKVVNQGGNWEGSHIIGGSPSGEIVKVVLDRRGNLYFATNAPAVYMIAAGTTNAVAIGAGLSGASTVALDAVGNVFIIDSGNKRIVEIPVNVDGTLNTTEQFTVAGGLTVTTSSNVAVLPGGNLAFDDGAGNLNKLSFSGSDLGESPVHTAANAATINYVFNRAASPTISFVVKGAASAEFVSTGGTCSSGNAYAAGDACTLNVALAPATVGARAGAAIFSDGAGNTLSAFPVSGAGVGPGLVFDPGTQAELKPGSVSKPQAVALDGAGNVYVADSSKTSIIVIPSGTGTVNSVGSGLSSPSGIAVDGIGNLYIADTGNNQIVLVPNMGGTLQTSAQKPILTNIKSPAGLVVDRLGNVYVAATGDSVVMKLSKSVLAGGVYLQSYVGTGFVAPSAVAVDDAGNIFVADTGSAKVVEISTSGSQSTVVAGLGWPTGLAVDAAGSIYIADGSNKTVTKIPFQNGAFDPNAYTWIGSGFNNPQSVTLDPAGNAYVADPDVAGLFFVNRTQGLFSFGSFNTGYKSDTQVAQLYSIGNQPANATAVTSTGDSGDFTVDATACINTPVAAGTSCLVSAYFVPAALGTRTAVSTFTSDAANANPIQLTQTGTGTNLTATTITIAITTPVSGNPSFGQAVTFSATVAAASGTPSGKVIFDVDGVQQPPVALVSGAATFTTSTFLGGSHTIMAKYTGDTSYASSVVQSPLVTTVDLATAKVSVSAKSDAFEVSNTYNVTDSATLTAKVEAGITTMPTGTVTFYAGTQVLGTSGLASGTAVLHVPAGTVSMGAFQLTAKYNGDVNFYSVTSPAASLAVTPSPTFDVASDIDSASVKPGGAGVFHVAITPSYNFGWTDKHTNVASSLVFTCKADTMLPDTACLFTVVGVAGSSQTVGSVTVSPANGVFPSVTLQLTTKGPGSGAIAKNTSGTLTGVLAMLVPGFLGIFSLGDGRKSRQFKIAAIILGLVVLTVVWTGCGGNNSNLPPHTANASGTASGTATVRVDVTSALNGTVTPENINKTLQLKFTVTN